MRVLGRPPALELAVRALLTLVRIAVRHFITETMMTLSLAQDVRLRLWHDLSGEYPSPLRQLTLPDLCGLLKGIDPTYDSLSGSGALDWANLPDRLHYIVELFRLYQQNSALFDPPFTPDQVMALKERRLPEGRL
jgi:hypothetical protein